MNTLKLNSNQRGSALIIALSILLVLTVLGVSAMRGSSLQERMAGNARDHQVAFESAETALRAAEDYITATIGTGDFSSTGGTGGKFLPRGSDDEAWKTEAYWASAATVTMPNNVSRDAQYIIQIIDTDFGTSDDINTGSGYENTGSGGSMRLYQITVRGYGVSPNSRVMLQSTFGERAN